MSHYAVVKFVELADTVGQPLASRPEVMLYGRDQLYLRRPVVETAISSPEATHRYAASGLELLSRSDGKYFLRTSDLAHRADIAVPDGLDIRLEYYDA